MNNFGIYNLIAHHPWVAPTLLTLVAALATLVAIRIKQEGN